MKKESSAKEKLEIVQPACWQAGPKGSLLRQRRTGEAGGRGVGGNFGHPWSTVSKNCQRT